MWRNQQGKGKDGIGNDEGDLVDADAYESEFVSEEEDEDN